MRFSRISELLCQLIECPKNNGNASKYSKFNENFGNEPRISNVPRTSKTLKLLSCFEDSEPKSQIQLLKCHIVTLHTNSFPKIALHHEWNHESIISRYGTSSTFSLENSNNVIPAVHRYTNYSNDEYVVVSYSLSRSRFSALVSPPIGRWPIFSRNLFAIQPIPWRPSGAQLHVRDRHTKKLCQLLAKKVCQFPKILIAA